ncbi:hypothetical protein Q8A73_023200 [Channa argus]|nr:hypothetical protein Q8A73_023200 [Channa argus]
MHETCGQLALCTADGIAGAWGCRLRWESEACKTPCFVSFGIPRSSYLPKVKGGCPGGLYNTEWILEEYIEVDPTAAPEQWVTPLGRQHGISPPPPTLSAFSCAAVDATQPPTDPRSNVAKPQAHLALHLTLHLLYPKAAKEEQPDPPESSEGLVSWVQCDNCSQWFHTICVGSEEQEEEKDEARPDVIRHLRIHPFTPTSSS